MADSKTYDAVLMNFIVLGEATMRLSNNTKEQLPDINWRAIKDFRNFLAHDYFGIDENVVWSAIQYYLPDLKKGLERL